MRIGKKRGPIHKDYGLDTGLEGEGIPFRAQSPGLQGGGVFHGMEADRGEERRNLSPGQRR